ncbi:MAG: hypothetical protein KBD01_17610 [Acidobacteria bacterium]|nr:hypothetical protein [Acidobacteriota bacterium]
MTARPTIAALLWALLAAGPALAEYTVSVETEERFLDVGALRLYSGKALDVAADAVVPADVYAFVNKVRVMGGIEGDLHAFAGDIAVDGTIQGDLSAAAGNVAVRGQVLDDARIAGGELSLTGQVGGHVLAAGGKYVQAATAAVGGSVLVYAGSAELAGNVAGPVRINAGHVDLEGTFAGDVNVKCDELKIGPGARIYGNLTYIARNDVIVPEGAVAGQVLRTRDAAGDQAAGDGQDGGSRFGFRVVRDLYLAFVALVAGVLMLLFFRPFVDGAVRRTETGNTVGISFGIGLVGTLVLLVAGILCLCLLPMAVAIWSALLALLYFGGIVGKMVLGRWVLRPLGARLPHPLLALVVGVAILFVVGLVPYLGRLVWLIVTVTGLGAALLQIRGGAGEELIPGSEPRVAATVP